MPTLSRIAASTLFLAFVVVPSISFALLISWQFPEAIFDAPGKTITLLAVLLAQLLAASFALFWRCDLATDLSNGMATSPSEGNVRPTKEHHFSQAAPARPPETVLGTHTPRAGSPIIQHRGSNDPDLRDLG